MQSNCLGLFELVKGYDAQVVADQIMGLVITGTWFTSVCSRSIFKSSFMDLFSQKMETDFAIEHEEQMLIRTAVDEALINSTVHGNLEMKTPPISNINEFSAYYEKIDQRLEIDRYATRHIAVQTWKNKDGIYVSIADQGPGYVPYREKRTQRTTRRKPPMIENRKSGRGMDIIKSVAKETRVDQQGRRITMRL